jgi:hypothetical protein
MIASMEVPSGSYADSMICKTAFASDVGSHANISV